MADDAARALRSSLGLFATGVCVVGAMDLDGQPIGLTVNSFSSVSLNPPLVLWSLDRGSDTMPVFEAARSFSINVLGDGAQDLSQRLSRKGGHRLHDGEWVPGATGATGAPVLRDAIAHFDCTVWARHDGGDHVILVGEVKAHAHREGAHPLLYYRGRYRALQSL
jgi:flavin reductase (DIM6/NTAB) family NADH-FMN oxidoreductase RutF